MFQSDLQWSTLFDIDWQVPNEAMSFSTFGLTQYERACNNYVKSTFLFFFKVRISYLNVLKLLDRESYKFDKFNNQLEM